MLVSSANNFTVLVGSTLPISLTYIKKTNGKATDPERTDIEARCRVEADYGPVTNFNTLL